MRPPPHLADPGPRQPRRLLPILLYVVAATALIGAGSAPADGHDRVVLRAGGASGR